MTGDHCDWELIRQAAAADERRAMQALAALLLTMVVAGVAFVLGVVAALA